MEREILKKAAVVSTGRCNGLLDHKRGCAVVERLARPRRRFKATTDSRHRHPIAPNLVERNFEAAAPDRLWVGDVKAVRTARGWLHLAVLMDLVSRRIVGFATSVANDTNLALSALRNSLGARRARAGLVHHTDRGSPYASAEHRQLLEQHGAVASMSRPRDCWDNAVAESFFSMLTAELLRGRRFASPEQAAAEIADYIEGFYNLARRHSTIGYVCPIEQELRHHAAAEAA